MCLPVAGSGTHLVRASQCQQVVEALVPGVEGAQPPRVLPQPLRHRVQQPCDAVPGQGMRTANALLCQKTALTAKIAKESIWTVSLRHEETIFGSHQANDRIPTMTECMPTSCSSS